MKVQLTVKLADIVDGVDLCHCAEGDVIDLSERDAALLLAEKWAVPADSTDQATRVARHALVADVAADQGRPRIGSSSDE